jgi:predicted nucleic acid-binding protein
MRTFMDSSAFAKRYIDEQGSEEVDKIFLEGEEVGISIICFADLFSALSRLVREGKLSKKQYERIKKDFFVDVEDIPVVNISPGTISQAIGILERNPVRASDSIHVASAIEWGCETFVTSDKRQFEAAKNEGLKAIKI